MKKRVLIFAPYFLPGVKGGGPINSINNMVNHLNGRIDFHIVTSDRDLGDSSPYPNIKTEEWINTGNVKLFYVDKNKVNSTLIKKLMSYTSFDYFYLNSFFDYKFSILPLVIKELNKKKIKGKMVLAPRGEFSEGALALKNHKKNIYINIFKRIYPIQDIIWHATTEHEKIDIQGNINTDLAILIAENMTKSYKDKAFNKQIEKRTGASKFIFLSRISPKKNLYYAIEQFKEQKGQIEFDIYGPIEDNKYWEKCQELITQLPENITVSYKGIVQHDDIIETFEKYHFFLFPTSGENFGHVISEALVGGCPVIISDQTPWLDLEKKNVGWDISLSATEKFKNIIYNCVAMNQKKYTEMSEDAFRYGKNKSVTSKKVEATFMLFNE